MPTATIAKLKLARGATLAAMVMLAVLLMAGTVTADSQPPVQPSNPLAHLIAGPEQEPQIRVSWDAPEAGTVTGHTVSRNDGQSFSITGGANTYSDYAISPGTSYSYTVIAHNTAGASPESVTATATVPAAPSAPRNLAAETGDIAATDEAASVTLNWSASTVPEAAQCETSYPVSRYTVTRSDGDRETELADLEAGATSFTDDTAAFGATYTYRVMARSAIGSSPAAEISVNVGTPPVPAPTGLTASISDPFDGNVSLSWTAPEGGPAITGYTVTRYLGTDPYGGTDIPDVLAENAAGTTLTDSGAQAGVTYSFLAMARSAHNVSDPSNVAVMEAPAPATGVTASVDSGAVNLSWTAPAIGTAGSYRVERMATGGEWGHVSDTSDTTYADDTAPADNAYTYRVQHRNGYGGSAWTESNSATILGVPPKVAGVTAAVSGNDIVVTWDAPETGTVDTYEVSYGPHDSEDRDSASMNSSTSSFTHSDNTEGVTYQYTVRARNAAGNGPWSDPVTARRLNPPQPPTGVEARVSGTDIVLSWNVPATGIVDSYEVRSGVSGSEDTATSETTETSFTHEGSTGDTRYSYQVRSKNQAGESVWTDPVTATRVLPPNPPTGIKTSHDDSNIVVTWTAPGTGTVGGYQLEYRPTMTAAWNRKSVDAAGTSWTHEGPTPGTTYEYRLRTVNAAGVSEWTTPVEETWYRGAAPPTYLQNFSMGTNRILVLWNRSTTPGTTGYEFRQNIDGGEWTVTSVSNRNVILVDWNEGESYREYAVRAVIGEQKGDWTATRTLSLTRPSGVRNLKAYLDGRNSIRVKWDHPETGEPAGYKVSYTRNGVPSVSVTRRPGYLSTTLIEGFGGEATYSITVRALSHSGLTDEAGSTATVTVRTEPEETVWPREPSGLDTKPVDRTTVRLTWNAPAHSTSNITGYRIYRKETSDSSRLGDSRSHILVSNSGSTGTAHVDHTAAPGVRYQYGVAVRRDGTATPVGGITTQAYGGGT